MNYCPNCGTKIEAGTSFCPKCGLKITEPIKPEVIENAAQSTMNDKDHEILRQVAWVFMIISTIIGGIFLIPLCWMLPMTLHYNKCRYEHRKVGVGFAVCTILFLNAISGILIICDESI